MESVAENNADVLVAVEKFLTLFVVYPSENARVAHVLWVAHTHLMDRWDSTPRLVFEGPDKRCGKTRALEVTKVLVPRPGLLANSTAAYLVRKVSHPNGRPTILLDETDTIFGPRAKRENEELRCFLNAGYRQGATVGRCAPTTSGKWSTEDLPAYCAVALAGIGNLPDTIRDRAAVIRMMRRRASEPVEQYRPRDYEAEGHALRNGLVAWANSVSPTIMKALPVMPSGIVDRAAEVWEPLVAVADAAGGQWPERARAAANALVAESQEEIASDGERLLVDLRGIWLAHHDPQSMFTKDILDELNKLEEAPWGAWRGGWGLDSRGLANLVRPYRIGSTTVRVGKEVSKGYRRDDLVDLWERYTADASVEGRPAGSAVVTDVTPVTDFQGGEGTLASTGKPPNVSTVA